MKTNAWKGYAGPALVAAGGLAIVIGAALPWLILRVKTTILGIDLAELTHMTRNVASFDGLRRVDGQITIILGSVLFAVGAALAVRWVRQRPHPVLVGSSIAVVVAAVVALGIASYDLIDIRTHTCSRINPYRSICEITNMGRANEFRARNPFSEDVGNGLYVVIGGAAVALVAGLVSLRDRGQALPRIEEPEPSSP